MNANQHNLLAKLPWWTWVLPLPVFFIGTQVSLLAQVMTGTSLLYFPLPLALVLTYWWGPRVLLPFYINATLCAGFWGLNKIQWWPVYGLPEVVFVYLSWLFFVKVAKGKAWLPDITQVIYFLLLGIALPLIIYKFMLESIFVLNGDAPVDKYWNLLVTTSFGDFISTFCVSTPLLYFLSGLMKRHALFYTHDVIAQEGIDRQQLKPIHWLEIMVLASLIFLLNQYLDFGAFWFLYGIISLYTAIRFGFGMTIGINSYILLVTYIIPSASTKEFTYEFIMDPMLKIQLGTALLYVFSIFTGRLVSDMRASEYRLNKQNQELARTNQELDQFVYSVSHDLSAPLKSILGLVNISRITNNTIDHMNHFTLIEKSVLKLEVFVGEILDYSRNKRLTVVKESIMIADLCDQILNDLRYLDGYNEIQFNLTSLEQQFIDTDRVRLKIILSNLLTNAIKFRRKPGMGEEPPFIRMRLIRTPGSVLLTVEDNGEGIKADLQERIFDMFFRASEGSKGSGLGLYIAREAAKRIGADIFVASEYGRGSTFTLMFPV